MRIYVDWPWSFDGKLGAPFRANIHTRKYFYLVGVKSQVWTKREGFTDRWAHFTRCPEDPGTYRKLHTTKRHSKFWSGKCGCAKSER